MFIWGKIVDVMVANKYKFIPKQFSIAVVKGVHSKLYVIQHILVINPSSFYGYYVTVRYGEIITNTHNTYVTKQYAAVLMECVLGTSL